MSDMIERVAKAIFADAGKQGAGHGNFDILLPEVQDGIRSMARAAIEAMRVPTEGMRFAVAADWGHRTWARYSLVIDAALSSSSVAPLPSTRQTTQADEPKPLNGSSATPSA